jgi:hypothetical protein
MRSLLIIGFAAFLSGAGLSEAAAAPARLDPAAMPEASVLPVQMQCSMSACVDPRTGAYTQSRCDYRGCRPVGGIVGYVQPQAPYGAPARPRGYGYEAPPAYGYGHQRGYGYGSRPGQYAPPAGMSQQEYEAYRAGSGGG